MYISRIKLRNWRNFQKVEVELHNRVFLVGPNASGKSNFLDVFRFLRDISKSGGGLQKAVSDRGGISKIRCLSARRTSDISVEVFITENKGNSTTWRYCLSIKQESRGHRKTLIDYEKVYRNEEMVLKRPDIYDSEDELRLTETHLEQISANVKFRILSDFFKSVRYLHLVPQLVRHPEIFSANTLPEDPFGQSFLERLAKTPEKTRKSRLLKIEEALGKAVPQIKKLSFIKDEIGIPHLEALYEHWRPNAGKQREDQFSDGTLRLIGLLWSFLDGDSLLLMEEPELSLNVEIVKKLASIIYRLQKKNKRQVLISTHSADLLSDRSIGAEEVLLLKPDLEGTDIQPASKDNEIVALLEGGMSVGEASFPKIEPPKICEFDGEQMKLFE